MTKKIIALALALPLFGAGCLSSTMNPTNTTTTSEPQTTSTTPATTTTPLPSTINGTTTGNAALKRDLIQVTNVQSGQSIKSPFTVKGKARGNWYFEASFPFELKDANGTILASGPVQAQGDWMTTSFVPFSLLLTFPTPATTTGLLILKKDNPSGLPANEDQLVIPVRF